MDEIQRIEKAIKRAESSGNEVSDIVFSSLKTYLTERIIIAISSRDKNVRAVASRVSRKWSEIDINHQKRTLDLLSSKF